MLEHDRLAFRVGSSRSAIALALFAIAALGCRVEKTESVDPEALHRGMNGHHPPNPPPAPENYLVLLVQSSPSGFTLQRTTELPGKFPKARGTGGPDAWSFRALSAHGSVLAADTRVNPHVVTGSVLSPGAGQMVGAPARSDTATFGMAVPPNTKVVQFFEGTAALTAPPRGPVQHLLGSITISR